MWVRFVRVNRNAGDDVFIICIFYFAKYAACLLLIICHLRDFILVHVYAAWHTNTYVYALKKWNCYF